MLHAQASAELRAETPASVFKPTATAVGKKGDERIIELHGPVTFFGSHQEVQVRLKHHTIAPAHCAIINTGSSLILRDLASRSGTKLNGEPIDCARLNDGDTVRIAGWKFRVGFSRRAGSGCGGSSIAAVSLNTTSGMYIESAETGKRWDDLPEIIVIGRRGACDIALDRDGVSRAHAMICRLDGRIAIFDLKSANGVKVNGQRTSMSYLSPGDLIRIGGHELRVGDSRNAVDLSRKSCESRGIFDGVADEKIRLSPSDGDAPSVGFMDVAGAAPELTSGGGLRAIPDRRDRLGMRFEQQADELSALKSELATLEQELVKRASVLHKREVALDARIRKIDEQAGADRGDADLHPADTREAWLGARAKELDARETQLAELHIELDRQRESLSQDTDDTGRNHASPTVADLCDVEQKLASREAVLDELANSLDLRGADLSATDRELQARQTVLGALSKSLDGRAQDLDAKHRTILQTESKFDAWREELSERADGLDIRTEAITRQEEVVRREANPMAVSDDRSYEILRLLDPVLGDSVRVLRRLGIGGSFDELVERAKCELSAGEQEKKSRGRWSLFS